MLTLRYFLARGVKFYVIVRQTEGVIVKPPATWLTVILWILAYVILGFWTYSFWNGVLTQNWQDGLWAVMIIYLPLALIISLAAAGLVAGVLGLLIDKYDGITSNVAISICNVVFFILFVFLNLMFAK